jgi:hypothetical protein
MPLLRSRDLVRPARITFDVLDVESYVPGRDGWDIQGVLVGKQTSGVHNWYVFLVGVVLRSGYRPTSIADIRLVALSVQGARLDWRTSPTDPQAVQRYLDAFRTSVPIRFPGDTDRFSLKAAGDHVSVQELRSRAEWSLRLFGKVAHAARIHDRLVASPAPRAQRPRDCELEQYCRLTAALGRSGISRFVSAVAPRCTLLEEVKRIPMCRPVGEYNVFDKITRSSATSRQRA